MRVGFSKRKSQPTWLSEDVVEVDGVVATVENVRLQFGEINCYQSFNPNPRMVANVDGFQLEKVETGQNSSRDTEVAWDNTGMSI